MPRGNPGVPKPRPPSGPVSVVNGMKTCTACRVSKPVAAYHVKKDGCPESCCRACKQAQRKAKRAAFSWVLGAEDIARFWSKTRTDEGAGCIEWQGPKDKDGYGFFAFNWRQLGAHRVAWVIAGNVAPEWPMVLDHRCYNPVCVNVAHLRAIPQTDNANRFARRERTGNSQYLDKDKA